VPRSRLRCRRGSPGDREPPATPPRQPSHSASGSERASREVEATSKCYRSFGRGLLGSPLDLARPVSMPVRRSFSVRPSPGIVRPLVHPSVSLVPFRVPSPSTPARDVSVSSSPARVSCLFAASPAASTYGERFHALAPVPSSGFLSLSTVCSATDSAGLFHPAATYRLHAIQGLLSPCSRPSLRKDPAPLPLATLHSPAHTGYHAQPPRLRGLVPHGAAFTTRQG